MKNDITVNKLVEFALTFSGVKPKEFTAELDDSFNPRILALCNNKLELFPLRLLAALLVGF